MSKSVPPIQNWYYHRQLARFYRFTIPAASSVLTIHHGYDYFRPYFKKSAYASANISLGEKLPKDQFDYIIISDTLSFTSDIQKLFGELRACVKPETRIVISYYNFLWKPLLTLAEAVGLKQKEPNNNWLTTGDIVNLLELEDYQVIKTGNRLLFPVYIPFVSWLINTVIANLPIISSLCFINTIVARPRGEKRADMSVSIIIPARNEEGNIEKVVKGIPNFGSSQEIIFVEGHSKDNTWKKIQTVMKHNPGKHIKAYRQKGEGKADAVRLGFSRATGDILMIFDADISVSPSDLPKFYEAIVSGKGEYINGSRLVYPVDQEAMRFLNMLGNHFFSLALTWILHQEIKDTLCGTKVISKENYRKIAANRSYFGEFDPFGDFDLLFGAAKLNLKFIEVPVRYHAREYGTTNISRFRHGLMLLQMTWFALWKMKMV